MIAVGKLAPTDQEFQDEAFTRQYVMDKLVYWREQLRQACAGTTNTPGVLQCRASLDTWLEELAGIAELRWMPTTAAEKRIMEWRN